MPTTMFFASPQLFCSTHTMASSGLVMQMTKALGAYFLMPAPTCSITLMLMLKRSSRLIPGLRGTPARSEEHTSELQSRGHLVGRLLLEKKKKEGEHLHGSQKKRIMDELSVAKCSL